MLGARHEAAIAQTMQQGVHPVEMIELAELFLEDALNIPPAKGAHVIVRSRGGFDARRQPIPFIGR